MLKKFLSINKVSRIPRSTYSSWDTFRRKRKPDITIKNSIENNVEDSPQGLLNDATLCDAITHEDAYHHNPYPDIDIYNDKIYTDVIPPPIDPSTKCLVLFPGENGRMLGKSKDINTDYEGVKEMYEEASDILGYDLLDLSINGPPSKLDNMKYLQPAIFVASLAATKKLQKEYLQGSDNCVGAAGYSLGDITALTYAGTFKFADALRLVQLRGECMYLASQLSSSGLMMVNYKASSRINLAVRLAREYVTNESKSKTFEDDDVQPDCSIASYVYPSCKIVGGSKEALEFILKNKDIFELKILKLLKEDGAYYTSLMNPAKKPFQVFLDNMDIQRPKYAVYSSLDSNVYRPTNIKKKLVKQLVSPVRWEQTMNRIYKRTKGAKYPYTYVCGPGAGIISRILNNTNYKAGMSTTCVKC